VIQLSDQPPQEGSGGPSIPFAKLNPFDPEDRTMLPSNRTDIPVREPIPLTHPGPFPLAKFYDDPVIGTIDLRDRGPWKENGDLVDAFTWRNLPGEPIAMAWNPKSHSESITSSILETGPMDGLRIAPFLHDAVYYKRTQDDSGKDDFTNTFVRLAPDFVSGLTPESQKLFTLFGERVANETSKSHYGADALANSLEAPGFWAGTTAGVATGLKVGGPNPWMKAVSGLIFGMLGGMGGYMGGATLEEITPIGWANSYYGGDYLTPAEVRSASQYMVLHEQFLIMRNTDPIFRAATNKDVRMLGRGNELARKSLSRLSKLSSESKNQPLNLLVNQWKPD